MPGTQQQLAFAIRAVNEANKALEDVQRQVSDVGTAADGADGRLSTFDQTLGQVFEAAERGGPSLEGFGNAIGGVAEAGGNLERTLNGVRDITGFLNEQFGISLGPLEEYAGTFAQLGGGIEAALQGGPALLAQLKTLPATLAPAIASTWAYVSALVAQAAAFIAANAPIILIVGGIALLAGGVVLLITHWDSITAKVPILGTALGVVSGAFDAVTTAAGNVLSWLTNHWPEVVTLISGPFAPIVLLATDAFGVRSAFEGAFTAAKTFVSNNWPEIATIISGPFFPLVALATDAFGVRSALEGGMVAARDFVSGRIDDIVGFFAGLPGRILETLGELGASAAALGNALRDGIVGGIRGTVGVIGDLSGALLDALKTLINSAIDSVNNAIPNDLSITILGKSVGIDLPDNPIPRLAEGGVVSRPTLALIGEAGQPEAVVPLNRAGSMGFGGTGGGVTVIIQGSVYGVDDLMYQIDRAAKRAGLAGLA